MNQITRRLPVIMALFIVFTLSACVPSRIRLPNTGNETKTPNPATDLANTNWKLVSFGLQGSQTPAAIGASVTLNFKTGGRVEGTGGCNSYGGEYQQQGNSISFSQIIHTEIACLDQGVMNQEKRFFQALNTANRFELKDSKMTIFYSGGKEAMNFVNEGARAEPTP